jgi:hypothetical protein
MRAILLSLLTTFLLAACAAVPKDIAMDASSRQGLVLIEVADSFAPRPYPQFSVSIAEYSPTMGRLAATSFGGWASVNSANTAGGKTWLVGRAAPGTYVISALTHQSTWHTCFNEGTRMFEVEPGKVHYLGRIDPNPALLSMALELPSYSMNSQHHFAMDKKLVFTAPADLPNWRADAEQYLRTAFPGVTGAVTDVASTEATFNTGRDAFGLQRVCGGYYAKRDDK